MKAAGPSAWVIDPILPDAWILAGGAVVLTLTIVLAWKTTAHLGWRPSAILTALRTAATLLILLLLLQLSLREEYRVELSEKLVLFAIDVSGSMAHKDDGSVSRIERVQNILARARPQSWSVTSEFFQFDTHATPLESNLLKSLMVTGKETAIHRSLDTVIRSIREPGMAKALVLLSDGHDFEGKSPELTAFLARSYHVPIYAIPVGEKGRRVRDISVQPVNQQAYVYVGQTSHLEILVRATGCEFEDIRVELVKGSRILDSHILNTGDRRTIPVTFPIRESETGTHEYEVRVQALPGETEKDNNVALTFLNVIEEKSRILILEGSPNWETSFLIKALRRNDKFELNGFLQLNSETIRKFPQGALAPALPQTLEDFSLYEVVVLGRDVSQLLDPAAQKALEEYVAVVGGVVIFTHPNPFGEERLSTLEPVVWGDEGQSRVTLDLSSEGENSSPFKLLKSQSNRLENLPELFGGRQVKEIKTLAAPLALGVDAPVNRQVPGFIHRRYQRGQVLSVGLQGFWRTGFHEHSDPQNNLFHRFWDQMIVWLVSQADFNPSQTVSLRASSSQIQLGDEIYFRLASRSSESPASLPVSIRFEDEKVAEALLAPGSGEETRRLSGSYRPEQTGRFSAEVLLPDGSRQSFKFIVTDMNLEKKEVEPDLDYLSRLCEHSGGRILDPEELAGLDAEIEIDHEASKPRVELTPIWDSPWVYYLIGILLAGEWFLRRRWGLS